MSIVENSRFTIKYIITLIFFLFLLVSCSNYNIMHNDTSVLFVNKYQKSSNFLKEIIIKLLFNLNTKNNLNNEKHITFHISSALQSQNLQNKSKFAKKVISLSPVGLRNSRIFYKRQYKNIKKGSHLSDNIYIVKYGDTLFYIAWITGNNLYYLAKQNNIRAPYNLNIGQVLYIHNNILTRNNAPLVKNTKKQNFSYISKLKINNFNKFQTTINSSKDFSKKSNSKEILLNSKRLLNIKKIPSTMLVVKHKKSGISNSSPLIHICYWPTTGKIIKNIVSTEEKNNGIDIAGNKGQAIVAISDGRIVYAGNALRGYGNLIIIKHKNDFLSAYAHNDTILVKEQQYVKAGQKIATMGSTGTNSTHLHFEIRYKGRSVNPLQYLPQK